MLNRKFSLTKQWKLQFRSGFFNVNHANWNNPTSSVTSGTFGPPCIIQMAMKLHF